MSLRTDLELGKLIFTESTRASKAVMRSVKLVIGMFLFLAVFLTAVAVLGGGLRGWHWGFGVGMSATSWLVAGVFLYMYVRDSRKFQSPLVCEMGIITRVGEVISYEDVDEVKFHFKPWVGTSWEYHITFLSKSGDVLEDFILLWEELEMREHGRIASVLRKQDVNVNIIDG